MPYPSRGACRIIDIPHLILLNLVVSLYTAVVRLLLEEVFELDNSVTSGKGVAYD